ncbi:cysteine-rich KTR domain-containing protein [Blautia marasmi]
MHCPVCGNKTRLQIQADTELKNFPLYCPKCRLWRFISPRRVSASNGRQNRFFYRCHRNWQSRKNIVFMRLCRVFGIHFLRCGEQIILLFFIINHRDKIRKHLMELRQFTGRHVNALYAEALSV